MLFRRHTDTIVLLDGVHAFYTNALLRALVFALVSIFVPVFVYEQSVVRYGSISAGLIAVAIYYIVQRSIVLFGCIPISKVIEKIGFRRSISVSVIFLIGYFTCLILAKDNYTWIWAATVCMGFNIPFYWIARDSALSQDATVVSMGRSMAAIQSLETIASLAGPFVAGVIIERWGFFTLFSVALVLMFLSVVTLWYMPHHSHRNGVSLYGLWLWITNRRYFHQAVGTMGAATQDYAMSVVWPLVLFLIGVHPSILGSIYSVAAISTLVVKYVTGFVFDRLHKRHHLADEAMYAVATLGSSVAWLVRIFLYAVWQVFVTDSLAGIFTSVYYGFQDNYVHLGGKRMGSIAFWVYTEMSYSALAIITFLVMIVGVHFGIWKELVFLFTAGWVLFSIVLARESSLS